MNELMIFENERFGKVRAVEVNNETYFVGKDVAEALGYKDTVSAIKDRVDAEDKLGWQIAMADQKRKVILISESGVYALIFGSKLEKAKEFKHWVTSEVLPSIRKTGEYKRTTPTKSEQIESEMIGVEKAKLLVSMGNFYTDEHPEYKQILDAYATKYLTGEFILPLPVVERKTFSATDIGKMFGISSQKVGKIANSLNLKTSEYGKYYLDKAKGSGKEVETFRYYENAIPLIENAI